MAGQPRQPFVVFGSGGVISAPTNFGQFGSLEAGGGFETTDIATIMALPAWTAGDQGAVYTGGGATAVIPLQEDNGWKYVHSYTIGGILQDGIPQWQVAQVYQIGSIVQDASNLGQLYQCQGTDIVGGTLPAGGSTGNWRRINPPLAVVSGALAAGVVPKIGGAASTGPASSQTLVAGLLTDDGTNVVIGGSAGTNGLKFPDASIQLTAAVNTNAVTQQSPTAGYPVDTPATPTRALGVVYKNTLSKPRFVCLGMGSSTTNIVYCDTINGLTTVVASYGIGIYATMPIFFIVLPGYKYSVTATGTLAFWTEWY